jgi:HlyD family secretion protein
MPFDALAKDSRLGGEALQEERKLQTDIDLANEELSRAASKVEWTRTLKDKGYVTGSELEADELAWRRQQVILDQAKTALDLFLVYSSPKAAEKAYTDWRESQREYDRVDARSNSEVASAKSDAAAKKEALAIEETRYKKVQDQIEKCIIVAPQPGMVVYDTSNSRYGQDNPMQKGTTVRHQQVLLNLPDMSEMVVKAKLNEAVVKQAVEGAPAFATIDAFSKARLTGKVTKIAVMPDRSNMWLNPGLKAYVTEVTLDQTPPGLKPGMSAQVSILVDTRNDVLQVPISAIHVDKGFQVAYVKTPAGTELRRVEVGLSNDRTAEILKGVAEGEEVYLFKPTGAPEIQLTAEEAKSQEQFDEKSGKGKKPGAAKPAPGKPGPAEVAKPMPSAPPAEGAKSAPAATSSAKDAPAPPTKDVAGVPTETGNHS